MSRCSPLPQNGPSPSKAAFSNAAASKRLFALRGSSSITSAIRDQTASQPSRSVSILAVPAGYPNGKSKPTSNRRPAAVAFSSSLSIRPTASRRVAGFSGSSVPFTPRIAIQMLSLPCFGLPLADQSTATYPSKSFRRSFSTRVRTACALARLHRHGRSPAGLLGWPCATRSPRYAASRP